MTQPRDKLCPVRQVDEIMKNSNIEKFTTQLLTNFPEFLNEMKPDDLQPYMIFGDFGLYIRNLIDYGNYQQADLDKIFSFLNEMGRSSGNEVHNLLTVGVLEIITDSSKATILSREYLNDQALNNFNLIYKYWYNE